MTDDATSLLRILRAARTIAVVGLSAEWHRPSYFAAKYMQEHGYRIVPVNPRYTEVLGETCYPSLEAVPFPVDMVDVFRKADDVPPIARAAWPASRSIRWCATATSTPAAPPSRPSSTTPNGTSRPSATGRRTGATSSPATTCRCPAPRCTTAPAA